MGAWRSLISSDMSPIKCEPLSPAVKSEEKSATVPIDDILVGMKRKLVDTPSNSEDDEKDSDSEEEISKVGKKRVVKVVLDCLDMSKVKNGKMKKEDDFFENGKKSDSDESDDEISKVVKSRVVKVVLDRLDMSKIKNGKMKKEDDYFENGKNSDSDESDDPSLSSYEKMVLQKRAERLAFLQSLEIGQAKAEFSEAVSSLTPNRKKQVTQSFKRKPEASQPTRRSNRLANVEIDFSEIGLRDRSIKASPYTPQEVQQEDLPSELAFEKALKSDNTYEEFLSNFNVKESKFDTKFASYDKSVLINLSLPQSNVCKMTPARITSLSWHPSVENLILAAGDKYGNFGLWNIKDSVTLPYLFKIHYGNIPCMQFNRVNPYQLISASYDGTLRSCDLEKHVFTEVFDVSDETYCSYFDFFSPTTCIVSHKNGQVSVADMRIDMRRKKAQKRHTCHDFNIKTVDVHPVNKSYFITADNKGAFRLWDLRKLETKPVADVRHHKRTLNSAYFSRATGNSILTTSLDDTVCIFDSANLTQDIKLKKIMKHNNCTGRWLSIFRATWLPNSDDLFAIGSMVLNPRSVQIFDNNLNRYHNILNENLTTITSINIFHPCRPALASGNSSGKVFVFT